MTAETLFLFLSSALFLAGLSLTVWTHSQYQLPILVPSQAPEAQMPSPAPLISVIVPARDEARNIRRCAEALLAQSYPSYHVVVVDDRSSDATPQILADLARRSERLTVLHGLEPPPGWAGKPHALAQGAAEAGGEWLCFVDADTFVSPHLLASTLATAQQHKADMFSMMTDQILVTFWEKAILPVIFTALSVGFPARHVNDPQRPEAIANGQFILIRRSVYQAVGGHAAVRGEIAEDKALAERVKASGYRLVLGDGRAVARTRMYTSLAEIWEGWTKNIFLGMQGRLGLLLGGALTTLAGALLLPAWLAAALAWLWASPSPFTLIAALQVLLLWAVLLYLRSQAARDFGISPIYAFTLPLAALMFAAMMFTSAFRVLSGRGVRWKGRIYHER